MSYKTVNQKFNQRMSEEFQLLAEEKWIIDTLNKIKNQRNCLQIERLHLESLKSKLKSNTQKDVSESTKIQEEAVASTSAVNLMQNVTGKSLMQNGPVTVVLDDAICNEEELNLVVTNPAYSSNTNADFNMEEDEDEASDDDMMIDMNMLMNGVFK